jgi:hypothetical protein
MVFRRKYGVLLTGGTVLRIPILVAGSADQAGSGDWTPAAGDVKVSKDGGAEANIGTLPTATNNAWHFILSATELQAKQVTIRVVDSATKAVDDQFIIVETYGHASAMHPVDPEDVVRMAMTALPNAAADAAGGLVISDAGGLDIDSKLATATSELATSTALATVDTVVDAIKVTTDQFVFTVANQVDANALSGGGGLDAAGVRTAIGLATANLDTQLGDIPTVSEFNARTLVAADYFDPATDTVANVTLVATTTTNTDLVTAEAIRSEIDSNSTQLAAIVADTNQLQTDWVDGGRLDLILDARSSQTSIDSLITDLLTTQMTESYAADGVAPTLTQALLLIQQRLYDFAISGTALTVKKLDGSTTAATITLDSATAPTSSSRTA